MQRKAANLSSLCLRQAKDLFGDLLATGLLEKVPGFRNRPFPLPVVFWTFLCQVLASGSCRHGVTSVQALLCQHGKAICSPSTAAYCKARVRIPIRLIIRIHRHLVAAMCHHRSPRTFVVDGTTLSMPDTPANQAVWPQSRSQKEGCGFPIMRLVGLFDLATGVWIGAATGPFRSSERNLCRKLWKHVRAGDTIVADSGFCCWFTLYLFSQKGVKVIMRNNAIRKPDPRAATLGRGDRLERWRKPNIRPKWISPRDYASMPDSIAVRVVTVTVDPGSGFRTAELQIACTVLDPSKMSALDIGAIYQSRWKVELFIDDLKTTLGMAVLRTLSPAMVRRELYVHIIAYNLLRALMMHGKASGSEGASFKGTIDRLNQWLPVVLSSSSPTVRRRLVTDLVELVAEDQVPNRPFRREPRAVKRLPKPHQLLNVPRHQMIEISHRSRYKKATDEIIPNHP
ncbi:MAG: IS4 family transposase [Akkermansiaceae bacterium]|nr:IS4 family transposase [Akkermansiaceae bacterium]